MKILNTKDITETGKIRIMIYGKSGSGKTRLISTIPGKTLVLNIDKGMATLAGSDVDYVNANTWPEVIEFLNEVKKAEYQDKYSCLVFDDVTSLADLLMAHLEKQQESAPKADGFALWKEYGGFMMKFFRFIRDQTAYDIVANFQAVDKDDDSGVTNQVFGVQGQVGSMVPKFFDEVLPLRILSKEKGAFAELQTKSSLGWTAKDRSKKLLDVEKPDLTALMGKIRSQK